MASFGLSSVFNGLGDMDIYGASSLLTESSHALGGGEGGMSEGCG